MSEPLYRDNTKFSSGLKKYIFGALTLSFLFGAGYCGKELFYDSHQQNFSKNNIEYVVKDESKKSEKGELALGGFMIGSLIAAGACGMKWIDYQRMHRRFKDGSWVHYHEGHIF